MATTVDPILSKIDRTEVISDPALRELYFGSSDYRGLIPGAQSAAQRYLDMGPSMRGTAGLSPLEKRAMQDAMGGIGGYRPYLRAQEEAIRGGMGLIGQE